MPAKTQAAMPGAAHPHSMSSAHVHRLEHASGWTKAVDRCGIDAGSISEQVLKVCASVPPPGMQLSPHTVSPGTGVLLPGQPAPLAAEMAGPLAEQAQTQQLGSVSCPL